jgi:hypothetical protein
VSYFGLETQNRIDPDDVGISTWYEQHAPPGSLLFFVTLNFPNRLTDRYPLLFVPGDDYNPNLSDNPGFRANGIGAEDIPAIEGYIREGGVRHTFLVLSPSQERFARLYGLLPRGTFASIERGLDASPRFRIVKRIGNSRLYQYRWPAGTRKVFRSRSR